MEVVEILEPTSAGMTEPYTCRLDDGQLYVVKGNGATGKGLIAELCCAWLGRGIGLPIPDYAIAEIPSKLLNDCAFEGVQRSLGGEFVFASLYQHMAMTLSPALVPSVDKRTLARLYAFDHWVANSDRTLGHEDGNPNVMVRLSADKKLIILDHNLAFNLDHNIEELELHVGKGAWAHCSQETDFIADLVTEISARVEKFETIMDRVPEDWLEKAEPDLPSQIRAQLARALDANFWSELG